MYSVPRDDRLQERAGGMWGRRRKREWKAGPPAGGDGFAARVWGRIRRMDGWSWRPLTPDATTQLRNYINGVTGCWYAFTPGVTYKIPSTMWAVAQRELIQSALLTSYRVSRTEYGVHSCNVCIPLVGDALCTPNLRRIHVQVLPYVGTPYTVPYHQSRG